MLDFWATWCGPCRASMPLLSALARKYRDKVTFIAMDVLERDTISGPSDPLKGTALLKKIKRFVDSMGMKMDFRVATDDSGFMVRHWLYASAANGIPADFVVDAQGKIAWIGNPAYLDEVLPKILNKSWDIEKARARRISNKRFQELDFEARGSLNSLFFKWDKLDDLERADSMLAAIRGMIEKSPALKYGPDIVSVTFRSMLIADPEQAYRYGKKIINISSEESSLSNSILREIEYHSGPQRLPGYIYGLGAEACQKIINNTKPVYRPLLDTSEMYHEMDEWYRLAGATAKAEVALQKSYNTEIIQRLKANKKGATSPGLVLNDPYSLLEGASLHSQITDTVDGLTRVYKLYLDHPETFMIGGDSSIWSVEPGDTLVLDATYSADAGITFNALNTAGLKLPGRRHDTTLYNLCPNLSYHYYFTHNSPTDSIFNSWLVAGYNLNQIEKAARLATTAYMARNPLYADSKYKKAYVENWYEQMVFRDNETILDSKYRNIFTKDSSLLKRIDSSIMKLAADIDQQAGIKTINYWRAIKSIYNDILSKTAKASHYNIDSIGKMISPFNDTTRQFVLLNLLGDSSSSLIDNNMAWNEVANKIDLEIFQPYLNKYLRRKFIIGPGYLNVALRGVTLYDTALKEITFDSMFQATQRPYLFLAFCGSWSPGCIKEIAKDSVDQNLKSSDSVRLVWLFFENDRKGWLKVIKKYGLSPQNCFLVKDYLKMEQNFFSHFNWRKDFPHYFLFNREGRCIHENVVSFSQHEIKALLMTGSTAR